MSSALPNPALEVVTAAALLEQSLPLAEPCLITQVQDRAIAQGVGAYLESSHPRDTILTVIDGAGQAQQISLENFQLSLDVNYPCQIYLATPRRPTLAALQELIDVVAHLRDPVQGCPWDLAQTPDSLTPYVIEEAYEVVDAIRQNNPQAIAEELGDLLLQVILQSQLAQETEQFTLEDVATGITNKLIRRHPHVFADGKADTPEAVREQWDAIKAAEQGENETSNTLLSKKLGRYARTLPPLMAGLKIGEKASASGLDWPNISGAWEKFYEELAEFQEALLQGDIEQQQAELGDLLFTVINLARWCHLHPVMALQDSYARFIRRLEVIEGAIAQPLEQYSLEELEDLWQQAKAQLRQTDPNA